MRITFVLPPPSHTGGIRVIVLYARWLQDHGHDVTLIYPPLPQPTLSAKVRSLFQGNGWPRVPLNHPSPVDTAPLKQIRLDRYRPVTDDDAPDADVVVATWYETSPWVNGLAPSKGTKIYFMQDYGDAPGQPLDKILATFQYPMRFVTISPFLRDLIKGERPDLEPDMVPCSVDSELFSSPPRSQPSRPTVGFVYTEARQKGTDICCDAVEIMRKDLPELRVVAFGAHHRGGTIAVPEGTEFFSNIPDEELRNVYGVCGVWLFGSRREGFGLPILEAMACRTPVVATPAGAATALVDDSTGALVSHEAPEAMAEAALRILGLSDDDWRAMADRCREKAASYTWEDAARLFEQSLLKAAGASAPETAAR